MKEIWKSIEGYEGCYEVSNLGRAKSLERKVKHSNGNTQKLKERILKPRSDKDGYLYVNLCKKGKVKSRRVHRLVAHAFIPNPENKPCVNHKNGVKYDNRVENLEWMTNKENSIHASKNDLMPKGYRNGNSKLTDAKVRKIKHGHKGLLQREVAVIYEVSQELISRIRLGKTWKHI